MADPSIDALKRETEEQSRIYKQLNAETNSLIAAQKGLIKTLGLQKNSILGSIAHAGTTLRESIKLVQLKLQERNVLESQLAASKRNTELQRQNLEHAARLSTSLTGDRKIKAQKIADEYAKTYDIARKKEQSIVNQLTQTPSKSALAFSASAEILKSGVNVVTTAFAVISRGLATAGRALTSFTSALNKTQKEFGISLASAATLQANVMVDTVKDAADILTKIDYGAVVDGLKDAGSGLFDILTQLFTGGGVKGGAEALKNTFDKLNAPIPGKAPGQLLLRTERLEGIRAVQDEFGVINKEMGESLAQYAKDNGLNVRDLVKAQRVFSTTVRGDLTQVGKIQTRFFDEFKSKGLTPRVALDAITKYAELIARNGTRFADSFARAAADAKKIGVDLSKVDQIGDNIIDNFEGFLEGQAELGAMGFGFDTSRLAELAEMGDTGALFTELRSQLAGMGKDITKLRRSERLALESAFGINIGELQRLAGGTPQITPEDLQKESNSKLQQILTLMQVGGPLLGPLSNIAASLTTPGGLAIATITGIGALITSYFGNKKEKAEIEANKLFGQNKAYEARDVLRQAGFDKSEIEKFTQQWLSANNNAVQEQIKAGKMRNMTYSEKTDQVIFTKPWATRADGLATGGVVTGPGTGTSDSIPTMLSNGEYVLPAALVSKIGVGNLDKLRSTVGNTDYVRLISALMTGDMKNVAKISAGLGVEELIETVVKRATLGSSALAVGTVMAGKDVYDTYQANKDKPYPTWWSTRAPGEVPKWVQRKKDGGLISGLKSNLMTKGLSLASSKVPGFSKYIPQVSNLYDSYKQSGTGGLKSNLLNKGLGLLGNKVPMLSGAINTFKEGGIGGLKNSLLNQGIGMVGKKIPGLSGAMDAFSAFKQGGVKGALGSLAKGGIGKAIGGAIGTAIPIPGVGTMIGSMVGSRIGKLAGGLFGKKKGKAVPMGVESTPAPDVSTMMGSQETQQPVPEQKMPTIDTSGIEQKLNNFINALQNIQINMDGNQVGKVLVKTSEAAASLGVFRSQTR